MSACIQLTRRWMVSLCLLSIAFISCASEITFRDLSVEEALLEAKSNQKFVFIDLYAEWCRPCKWMEKEVFSSDTVARFFNDHFISLRVDAENEQLDFVDLMKVEAYPTMLFYEPKGRQVLRVEHAMEVADFMEMAQSLVNLNKYHDAYTDKPKKLEHVYAYSNSMKWVNRDKAQGVARSYLVNLSEKKYEDSLNWSLIREFVVPWDRVMFPRVVKNDRLIEARKEEFTAFMEVAMEQLLHKSIERKNSVLLRSRERYIKSYAEYLSNPDSLVLVGHVFYSGLYKVEDYASLLRQYVEKYVGNNATVFANMSLSVAEDYFQRDILQYGIELADRSNILSPSMKAYFAGALCYEKLNQFKSAYAYLLLGYNHANDEEKAILDEFEERIKYKMEFELREGVNYAGQASEDGRFTLGAGMNRLMYGYPVPQSTSHFVVNVDGKLASNTPMAGTTYLTGHINYDGAGITPRTEITFEFEGVTIVQALEPVDKEGEPIADGFAQFYKVSYQFTTRSTKLKKVGLGVLFDTMIDDNDACVIAADGEIIPHEIGFGKGGMPAELLFYRTKGDTSDMMGAAIIKGMEATPPDRMVVGRWPVLHRVRWKMKPRKVKYGDSAYLMQWSPKGMNHLRDLKFVTYYGLPRHKQPELRLIMKDEGGNLALEKDFYFENDQDVLDLNGKMIISDIVSNPNIEILGVLLNGYADIIGENEYNFSLSRRRIAAVGNIFKKHGVPYIPKPYGIEKSEDSNYTAQFGNPWDRRVQALIYYRLKRDREVVPSPN